jgi:O-antigen/teichoic acid export membrane protein
VIKKNLILSFLSASAKIVGGIGVVSILARVFTLGDFGNFTYSLTLGTVFALIVDYGYNIKVIKDVSLNPDNINTIVSKTTVNKILLFSLTVLAFFVANIILKNNTELVITGLFLFLSLIAFSFTNTILSVFKGRKEYKKDLKIVLVDNLFTILLVPTVALLTRNIEATSISFFVSKLIGLFYSLWIYKQENNLHFPPFKDLLNDLKQALPYAVHYWVGNLYLNIDTIIMKPMVSSEDLGIYQSGIRIIIGLGILLTVINSVYLPLLNENLNNNKKLFKANVLKLNVSVLRLSIIFIIGMLIFSKLIIIILFGNKFLELLDIFWILALIVGMRIIGASYGILLTISNKQALRAIAGAISIILIVICDLIFIPIYGYQMAAYTLLLAHFFITVFYIATVYFEYKTLFIPSWKRVFSLKNVL